MLNRVWTYLGAAIPPGAAPTISAASIDQGDTQGGELVVLTGTGFATATAVAFHGTPATDFAIVSGTEIRAIAPANAAGLGNITVTNPDGVGTLTNGWRVWDPSVEGDTVTFLERGDYNTGITNGIRWTPRVGIYLLEQGDGLDGFYTPLDDQGKEPRFLGTAQSRSLHDSSYFDLGLYLGGAADTAGTWAIGFRCPVGGAAGAEAYLDPQPLMAQIGGGLEWASAFSDSGFGVAFWDQGVGAWKTRRAACAVAEENVGICRWDAASFEVRANGGAWASDTRVGSTNFVIPTYFGANYDGSLYLEGAIRFMVFASGTWDDTKCGRLDKWAQNRHGCRIDGSKPEIWHVTSDVLPASPLSPKQVTIKGKGFTGATVVLFGVDAATSVSVVDDNTITCTPPVGGAGQVTVSVKNASGWGSQVKAVEYYDALGRTFEIVHRVGNAASRTVNGSVEVTSLTDTSGTADPNRDLTGPGAAPWNTGAQAPKFYAADADFGGEDSMGADEGVDEVRNVTSGTYAAAIAIASKATTYTVVHIPTPTGSSSLYLPINQSGFATNAFCLYGVPTSFTASTGTGGIAGFGLNDPPYDTSMVLVGGFSDVASDGYFGVNRWMRVTTGTLGAAGENETAVGFGTYPGSAGRWKMAMRLVVAGKDDFSTRRKMIRWCENFFQLPTAA